MKRFTAHDADMAEAPDGEYVRRADFDDIFGRALMLLRAQIHAYDRKAQHLDEWTEHARALVAEAEQEADGTAEPATGDVSPGRSGGDRGAPLHPRATICEWKNYGGVIKCRRCGKRVEATDSLARLCDFPETPRPGPPVYLLNKGEADALARAMTRRADVLLEALREVTDILSSALGLTDKHRKVVERARAAMEPTDFTESAS